MFPGDGSAHGEHAAEQGVERALHAFLGRGIIRIFHHQIDVDIAVTRVTEAGHRNVIVAAELRPELDQFDQFPPRHHDIFVQFFQSGGLERGGKSAPQGPEPIASFGRQRALHRDRAGTLQERGQFGRLRLHAGLLSVDLDEQMRLACRDGRFGPRMPARRLKGEAVSDFHRGRQMPVREDRLHRRRRRGHVRKTGRKDGPDRRPRQQAQSRFGDDAEQAFRAGEKSDQIKSRFVFMGAPAHPRHGAVGQHDLESEDVVAGHAVFQTARTARIGRDVSADAAILQTRRIRRVKKSLVPRGLLQMSGDHPRFDHGDEVLRAHLFDPVHPRGREHDAAAHRNTTAHVAVAGPAGRHGDFFPRRDFHHTGNR